MLFNEGYCRDIVTHTLIPLLYFKDNFIELQNLMGQFVASCDLKGNVNILERVPEELFNKKDEKDVELLRDCKTSANDKNWMVKCKPLC